MKKSHYCIFSFYFVIIFLINKLVGVKLKGEINVHNCQFNKSVGHAYPFGVDFQCTLQPYWSNNTEAKLYPSIPYTHYTYRWELYQVNGNERVRYDVSTWLTDRRYMPQPNGPVLIIKPFALRPGKYIAVINGKPIQPGVPEVPWKECYILYAAEPPVVKIFGGEKQLVPPDTKLQLSGHESYDVDLEKRSFKDLDYFWTCTAKKTRFCNKKPLSTTSTLEIHSSNVKEGDVIEVALRGTTKDDGKGVVTASSTFIQTIKVVPKAVHVQIGCEKNCPPVSAFSNQQYLTFLRAKCLANCDVIKDDDYEWTVEGKTSFDYSKTQFGRHTSKFVIKKNTFEQEEYLVTVGLKASKLPFIAKAQLKLNFVFKFPKIISCKLSPKKGDTFSTSFKLSCLRKADLVARWYNVYSRSKSTGDENLITGTKEPEIYHKSFKLPISAENDYLVKVNFRNGPPKVLKLEATVTSPISNKESKSIKKFIDLIYPDKKNALLSGVHSKEEVYREHSFETIKTLIDEVVNSKFRDKTMNDLTEKLKHTVIEDMLQVSFANSDETLKMAMAISKLVKADEPPESSPLMAKFTTIICKKMMEKHSEFVREGEYPMDQTEKTTKMSSAIVKCLESNANPNYSILKSEQLNITTEAPTMDEPMVTEDYDNYEDFSDSYYQNLDYLKESTYNIFSATTESLKLVAFTLVAGEEYIEDKSESTSTIVAKDIGKELVKSNISTSGVTLIPSLDFENDEHPYEILLATWKKDLMYWNQAKIKINTELASINVFHATCKEHVKTFENPAQVFFRVKEDTDFEAKQEKDIFVVPGGYQSLTGEDLSRVINVRRIAVPVGQIINVQFDIVDVIDVVVTNFEFPLDEHFEHSTTLQPGGTTIVKFINDAKYNVWCYIGVLANKTYLSKSSLTYNISIVAPSCVRWIEFNSSWVFACKSGQNGNSTVIHCECTEFSVLAGYLQNFESDFQKVEKAELELELQSCLVVFITVATTLAIYLLLMLPILKNKKSDIYYLADNDRRDRFAYIVAIKTGLGRYAPTTSNVVIRLIGSKKNSKAHVLNYPDPKIKLLQRNNQDMFLLATSDYLGDIDKVELWFDCIGPNPDWFCEHILVYDMQVNKEWYFKAKIRFSVTTGQTYAAIPYTKKEEQPKQKCVVKFRIKNHTWNVWQRETNFAYLKKLTVIFSTIFMTYLLGFMFYGVPDLLMRDVLDKYQYTFDSYTIFVAFMSSFPSFMVHITIAWFFRFSKLQFSRYGDDAKLSFRATLRCWWILIILMSASIFFLTFMGFWMPINRSLCWLTSCIIGIVAGVICYETVFLFFSNFVWTLEMVDTIGKSFHDLCHSIEAQRLFLHREFGNLILRPYFRHLYQPLEPIQIEKKKMVVGRRRWVISELEDLVMFGIYVIILYVVVWSNKDHMIVRSKKMLEQEMDGEYTRSLAFSSIESSQNVYNYINETLIPTIQPGRWYANYVISDPGLMLDMNNKIIGVARMRQQRVKKGLCKPPKIMEYFNLTCRPELSWWRLENRAFGYKWGPYSRYLAFDRLKKIWRYSKITETGTFGTDGEFASYTGGGYVSTLGRTLYNSKANFRQYFKKLWIDEGTRGIFFEFLTYNTNYNVFNSIKLLFEQSATSYTFKIIEVTSVRMLFVQNELEKISLIMFILFMLWVGVLFFKQTLGVVRKVRSFYRDAWFLVDCFIILMSIIVTALFIFRMKMIGIYLDKLEKMKHNEFLNYFYLFYLEDILQFFAATLVCTATIRLWKFLRFGLFFRIMERTIAMSVIPILSFAVAYVTVALSFALPLVLLTGTHFQVTEKVFKVLRPMFTMALKSSEMNLPQFLQIPSSVVYIVIYAFVGKIMLMIYIMIIMMCYSISQLEFSSEIEIYTIKNYIQERFKFFPKFLKYKYKRAKAGESEEVPKVEAKADKFVYSNSYSLETFKMITMEYITMSIFRNKNKRQTQELTDRDLKLMLGVSQPFLIKNPSNEVDVFFKGRISGKKIALIDERKVWKIANFVNLMLREKQGEVREEPTGSIKYEKCVQSIKKNEKTLKKCEVELKITLEKIAKAEMEFVKKIK